MDYDRRNDFPIFSTRPDLVYLDSAATSLTPQCVIDAMTRYYETCRGSVGRGMYKIAEEATAHYETVRDGVAAFVGQDRDAISFMLNTTDALNAVAYAWGGQNISAGDEIVISDVEHHANLLPWIRLACQKGAVLKRIPYDQDRACLVNWKEIIGAQTKLVAVTAYSNVLGPVWQPGELDGLVAHAHRVGARVCIDAAQDAPFGFPYTPRDADFIAWSAHKAAGPTGVGVLYVSPAAQPECGTYRVGGGMLYSASYDEFVAKDFPHRFEAGTPPAAEVYGLGAAVEYLNSTNMDHAIQSCSELIAYAIDELSTVKGVHILGDVSRIKREGHLISFYVDGVHAHDIASFVDQDNVCIRAGHHCAQPLHQLLGVVATVRLSVYVYNTRHDIQKAVEAIRRAISFFRK